MKPRVVFLVGPTAIGKTDIAVILAKKMDAQIISCDSMQVYKGMDIITSKPFLTLRKVIPHHLIDVVSPVKEYNVFRYRQNAIKKIKEIINRGKIPLFVGGTGLYMSILIDGIFKAKFKKPSIRNRLCKEVECLGSTYLYKRLKRIDPEAAVKIHPNDTKRIIRALEVFETCGQPISQLQKQRKGLIDKYEIKIFALNMERDKLYKRVGERVDKMFTRGLIDEAKRLLKLRLSKTASCAIGIKEVKGYLGGLYDLGEAKRRMKRNTCLYAKRQLTWFRKDKRIEWIGVDEKEKADSVANRIFRKLISNRCQ